MAMHIPLHPGEFIREIYNGAVTHYAPDTALSGDRKPTDSIGETRHEHPSFKYYLTYVRNVVH